jgi:hypothetical protein
MGFTRYTVTRRKLMKLIAIRNSRQDQVLSASHWCGRYRDAHRGTDNPSSVTLIHWNPISPAPHKGKRSGNFSSSRAHRGLHTRGTCTGSQPQDSRVNIRHRLKDPQDIRSSGADKDESSLLGPTRESFSTASHGCRRKKSKDDRLNLDERVGEFHPPDIRNSTEPRFTESVPSGASSTFSSP